MDSSPPATRPALPTPHPLNPPSSRSLRVEPRIARSPMTRARSPQLARDAPPLRAPHSPTALMRKPRGGRSARRHQASRSTCRLAGGACTSSTPRRSHPWKASREAARASREFQKQRAFARRKARNTARPPGSSAPLAAPGASSLLSTSASEPGASCTGRAMLCRRPGPAATQHWRQGRRTPDGRDRFTARRAGCRGNRASGGGVGLVGRAGGGAGSAGLGLVAAPPARRPIGVS